MAVDFPKREILLAHGGRPLWMQTAFFLIRRHPNVYLDISGIPPKTLLQYFPRLEEIAHKTLFGTDWPGPGVPDIKKNLDQFRALELTEDLQSQILSKTALGIWPLEFSEVFKPSFDAIRLTMPFTKITPACGIRTLLWGIKESCTPREPLARLRNGNQSN